MRKIMALFVVLFITAGVFGQKFIRSHSFIETTPTGNNTIEDAIHAWNIVGGDYDWVNFVHFIQNGKLYLLSYEPKDEFTSGRKIGAGTTRDIYLYSKDTADVNSPWEQASELVMTSLWYDIKNYSEVDFFRSELSRGSEGEVVIEDDFVKMTIGYELMTNGGVIVNRPITFQFIDVGNDLFKYEIIEPNPIADTILQASRSKTDSKKREEVKINTSDNGIGYEKFNNDNLSLTKVSELREKFINGENQIRYSSYSKHTYKMNFNAPFTDRNRNFEPENITNGYRRLYFTNSENVYAQSKVVNNEVVEVIYFHPDGRIYTIKKIVNGQVNGWVKFVDLENYVILEGEYRNNKLVGRWNTPVMGNFNVQDNSLINQYPGVVNQMLTLSNFYYYDRDTRVFKIN